MPEIASAWVTLTVSARGMRQDVTRAIQEAERSAKLNPKINTSALSAQGSKAGKEFGDKFSSSAKDALKTLSAVTIGAGLVEGLKKTLSVGMDWTNSLNTLQAVTGATTDQLNQAGAAARALGNDIALPATSANDAASAMTELAKGGFTVQQSMDAAKGSLQLAAAAQISATDAATIQSQALQAFGLHAGDAGKVADVLANSANASSAEITDVAQALQQAGTVANQFGLSVQDTSAAIALLANNGIKGSDAGTLLKSSLLALTDQGKPAQGAIKDLGLTVYDTNGKFVGLHELFRQLGDASHRMTPEMYQAATATLFGSDAMRVAGVAAKDGSAGFDSMRTSIDRQGAAADVAAAKTKGLPGAWERVKNAIESAQLNMYDVLEGPLTKAADGASKILGDLPAEVAKVWRQISSNPAVRAVGDQTKRAFQEIVNAVKGAAPAIGQIVGSLGKASAALGVGTWQLFVTALQAAAGVLEAITPMLSTIAGAMRDNQTLVTAAAGAWALFKTVPGLISRVTDGLSPLTTRVTSARDAFRGFGDQMRLQQSLARMNGDSIGTMGSAFATLQTRAGGALKSIGSGLLGALGGPWGIAIAGATTALGFLAQKHAEAAEKARLQIEQEHALQQTLDTSTGVITEATRAEVAKRFTTADNGGPTDVQRARSYGLDPNLLVDAATGTGNANAYDILKQAASQNLNKGLAGGDASVQRMLSQAKDAGITGPELQSALLKEGNAWSQVTDKLRAYNAEVAKKNPGAAKYLFGDLQQLVDKLPDASESMVTLTQNVNEQRRQIAGGAAAQQDYNSALNGTWRATQEGVNRFKDLGAAIVAVPDNKTIVVNGLTADAEQKVTSLGYTVERLPNGQVKVTAETGDALNRISALVQQVNQPVDMPIQLRILNRDALNLPTRTADAPVVVPGGAGPRSSYAWGGISAMAGGSLRQISKPRDADIYSGRGAGTIFAEEETGGEAYIPLAPGKRARSMKILAEVMRRFGMMADGGITIDSLKQYASQLSGGKYVRGGPPGPDRTDCSGAQSWIVGLLTGGTGRFTTANESTALTSSGFTPGDPPSGTPAYWIGWQNGGPGGGHTAGTIVDPNGGNVNVEMGGAAGGGQFGGSAAGASNFPNRAWIQIAGGEDPNASLSSFSGGSSSAAVQSATASLTSAKAGVTSAQASLDQANAAVADAQSKGKSTETLEKKRDAAQQRLDAATQRQIAAETRLADAKDKAAGQADKSTGGFDGNSLVKSLLGGITETFGIPNFMNLLDSPNVKSAEAFANWGLGLLAPKDDGSGSSPSPLDGVGASIGLPNLANVLQPNGPRATSPVDPDTTRHGDADGAAPGPAPVYQINGNVGWDPRAITDRFTAAHNATWRRNMDAVRPG